MTSAPQDTAAPSPPGGPPPRATAAVKPGPGPLTPVADHPGPGTLPRGLMTIALAMTEEQLLSKITLGTRREPGMCKQLGLGWIHHRRSEMANPGWPDLVIKAPAGRAA